MLSTLYVVFPDQLVWGIGVEFWKYMGNYIKTPARFGGCFWLLGCSL